MCVESGTTFVEPVNESRFLLCLCVRACDEALRKQRYRRFKRKARQEPIDVLAHFGAVLRRQSDRLVDRDDVLVAMKHQRAHKVDLCLRQLLASSLVGQLTHTMAV